MASNAKIRFAFNPQRHVAEAPSLRILYDAAGDFAQLIDNIVPDGRQKSIAMTELESVLLRAERGLTERA